MFKTKGNRGVSPVIGVILMVAITVVMAAVISTFVLGIGEQTNDPVPNVSFDVEFDDNSNVTISHQGGETVEGSQLSVLDESGSGLGASFPDELSAGDSVTVDYGNATEIQIGWIADSDELSAILLSRDIPE